MRIHIADLDIVVEVALRRGECRRDPEQNADDYLIEAVKLPDGTVRAEVKYNGRSFSEIYQRVGGKVRKVFR